MEPPIFAILPFLVGFKRFCWWGFLLGAVAGHAIKKVMKIAAIIIALFVIGIG
jgi:uncharacterized membrane protein (Fun14 family)